MATAVPSNAFATSVSKAETSACNEATLPASALMLLLMLAGVRFDTARFPEASEVT